MRGKGSIGYILSLGFTLMAFWLAMSGHYTPFLLSVGVGCVLLCVWIAYRMHVADEEGQPIHLYSSAPRYWAWLWVEIFKSAIDVSRRIWHPSLPISPTMTRVRASQKTDVGLATYANSITLTPGTITTGVEDKILTVYALTREGADDVQSGEMDRKVSEFEGAD